MILLPFLSGALTVFAYPPFSIPVLPFVGLVPLLCWLDRKRAPREIAVGGLAFAVPYVGGTLYWMFNLGRFTTAGWFGGAGVMLIHLTTVLFFPIAVAVLRRHLTLALPLFAPFAWTVAEHARSYGDLAFPALTLGYSLSDWPLLVQHADLVGVYGVSWWLVLVNALIATLILRGRVAVAVHGTLLAAALLVPATYDVLRWRAVERAIEAAPHLRISVIQPNVAQAAKWDPASRAATYATLNRLISRAEGGSPALVVGPEASMPLILDSDARRLPAEILPGARPLILGVVAGIGEVRDRRYERHYNSAFLAAPDRSILGRHDKQYLVPVTEQIPYKEVFGFLLPFYRKQFGRFVPAEGLHLLTLPGTDPPRTFGALICYESLFPRLVSRIRGMGASFLVNVTNDAWFGRSTFPYLHAGFCALRAIENRCAIVRSANTGVSTFVDPLGRQVPRSRIFVEDVLTAEVPLLDEVTVYSRAGDLLLYLSYAVVAAQLALAWRAHRRAWA